MYPYMYIVLPSYAVMAFLGAACSLTYLCFHIESVDMKFTEFLTSTLKCVLGIFIGSKLLFSFTQVSSLMQDFSLSHAISTLVFSGYVYYGGLFGAIFAIYLMTRGQPEKRKAYFDYVTPAIALFHGFGRIGCFLAGCCYGKECNPPLNLFGGIVLTRVPVQLIESAVEFILFIILHRAWVAGKKGLLPVYLGAYAYFRFLIEFLRGDEIRGIYFHLSTSQWISLFIILFLLLRIMFAKYRVNCTNVSSH